MVKELTDLGFKVLQPPSSEASDARRSKIDDDEKPPSTVEMNDFDNLKSDILDKFRPTVVTEMVKPSPQAFMSSDGDVTMTDASTIQK